MGDYPTFPFPSNSWRNYCTFAKNTKTSQCTSIAHAATSRGPGSVWMYRDVQSIAHITYIVEMNNVENSTYQVSVVDNVDSSSHLTRNLSGCYAYLFLSNLIYVDLQCTSSFSPSVGMYCNWVIYVTEYHKGCLAIRCIPYDLSCVSTSEMYNTKCQQVYSLVRCVSTGEH